MRRLIFPVIMAFFFSASAFAADTTSAEVTFDANQWRLSKEAKENLDGIIPADTFTVLTKFRIYGYCDPSEKDADNLSLKRAKEVKQYLLSIGIKDSIIVSVEGKGKKDPETLGITDADKTQNRRVLILIEYEAKLRDEIIIMKKIPKKSDQPQ